MQSAPLSGLGRWLREAGGVVHHSDGRDYHVLDKTKLTLSSPDESTWQRARAELFV